MAVPGGSWRLRGPSLRLSVYPISRFSTKSQAKKVKSIITSRVKRINEKYEGFLQWKFPRFYVIYSTFFKGFRPLFTDFKEVLVIKQKMALQRLKYHQLPYREMEKLRQFRRDIIKVTPLVLLSIPPFANYLVFALMYFYPRQLLMRYFWSKQQTEDFMVIYHSMRAQRYPQVVNNLLETAPRVQSRKLQDRLLGLSSGVQRGVHPEISELCAVSTLFSGPPLGLWRIETTQMKALSQMMFLSPHLPSIFLRRRLWKHITEIHHLDRALSALGPHKLSEEELRNACYVRGLNSVHLSETDCKDWLTKWLQLSQRIKESEASLLLHGMILLSVNYSRQRRAAEH
ncbi:LETM1 domain-containing protein 1 [Callorhinchus milii]|uniref:LETM1 domain-containing protein 1 n=1 Tax=Callorhinchus milii TaxID=7868 RepID=UPI001C3FCCBD|nr:LETM1 domain-containing protein 1 [Callorhinchus milii]